MEFKYLEVLFTGLCCIPQQNEITNKAEMIFHYKVSGLIYRNKVRHLDI